MLPCLLSLGCRRIPSQTLVGTTALMLCYYLGEAVASPLIGALEASFGLRTGMVLCCGFMMLSSLSCLLHRSESSNGTGTGAANRNT